MTFALLLTWNALESGGPLAPWHLAASEVGLDQGRAAQGRAGQGGGLSDMLMASGQGLSCCADVSADGAGVWGSARPGPPQPRRPRSAPGVAATGGQWGWAFWPGSHHRRSRCRRRSHCHHHCYHRVSTATAPVSMPCCPATQAGGAGCLPDRLQAL